MANLLSDIEWYRGDSYPLELQVTNQETSAAVDITGCSFKLSIDTLKAPPDDTTAVFEVAGVLNATPTTGRVTFTPTALQTDIDPKGYYYDIQMTNASGDIRTIVKSKFKITQDITK